MAFPTLSQFVPRIGEVNELVASCPFHNAFVRGTESQNANNSFLVDHFHFKSAALESECASVGAATSRTDSTLSPRRQRDEFASHWSASAAITEPPSRNTGRARKRERERYARQSRRRHGDVGKSSRKGIVVSLFFDTIDSMDVRVDRRDRRGGSSPRDRLARPSM